MFLGRVVHQSSRAGNSRYFIEGRETTSRENHAARKYSKFALEHKHQLKALFIAYNKNHKYLSFPSVTKTHFPVSLH